VPPPPDPRRPAPRRRWLPLLVIGLGVALGGVAILSYHPAPVVPMDEDHQRATIPAGCLHCHGPKGPHPRPPTHPINEACFSCHRWG
jgi:hypothetical protein